MIEINNLTRFKFDKKRLERLAGKVLERESSFAKATEDKGKEFDLSITFVRQKEIQKLNKKYRKIDRPTDVLSFTYMNSGEIVLCPQIIKQNAERFGETFKGELTRVLIHGILHILGYNHKESLPAGRQGGIKAEKMRKKEEYYNSSVARNI